MDNILPHFKYSEWICDTVPLEKVNTWGTLLIQTPTILIIAHLQSLLALSWCCYNFWLWNGEEELPNADLVDKDHQQIRDPFATTRNDRNARHAIIATPLLPQGMAQTRSGPVFRTSIRTSGLPQQYPAFVTGGKFHSIRTTYYFLILIHADIIADCNLKGCPLKDIQKTGHTHKSIKNIKYIKVILRTSTIY